MGASAGASIVKPQLRHRRSSETFHGCSTPSSEDRGVWDGQISPRRDRPNKKTRRTRHPVSKGNKLSNMAVGIASQATASYNDENEQNGARWNIPLELDENPPTRRGDGDLRATVASLKMTLEAQSESHAILLKKYQQALARIAVLEEKDEAESIPGLLTWNEKGRIILWISIGGMIVGSSVLVSLLHIIAF